MFIHVKTVPKNSQAKLTALPGKTGKFTIIITAFHTSQSMTEQLNIKHIL